MRNNQTLRLYKYQNLGGEHGHRAIERALLANELYWQSPLKFNDPFDCLPVLYFGDSASQRKLFHRRAAAQLVDGPRRMRRQKQREMNAVPYRKMEQILLAAWPKWLAESAVTCFSESPDHPLMWGHYADSHRGFCLIFEEIADAKTQWFGFPVEYGKARPLVNLTKFDDPATAMSALCQKSEHWNYEREQRMIEWHRPPGYRTFPTQALVGLILGAKIAPDQEAFVRGLAAQRRGLELHRAVVDKIEFKLNIVRET